MVTRMSVEIRLIGLDYAVNRYYSSGLGRFMSPDPYRASGGPADPGSWNRYSYANGDPVTFTDREGLLANPCLDPIDCPTAPSGWRMTFFLDPQFSGGEYVRTYVNQYYVYSGSGGGGGGKAARIDKSKIVTGAEKLLEKEKGADFVTDTLRKAFLDVNGVLSAEELGQFERGIYDSLSMSQVLEALKKAGFLDSGQAPVTTVGPETYTTIAHANFANDGPSSIDFYDPFVDLSSKGQSQTAIHEGMHLIWNIGDGNFAAALGLKGLTGPAASAAWDKKLRERCK